MRFLTATLIASLVGLSVSVLPYDDLKDTFDYEKKLPVLNSYFGLYCYGSSVYGNRLINRFVFSARESTQYSQGGIAPCRFDRFPSQELMMFKVDDDVLAETDTPSEVYIIMDHTFKFLAGMVKARKNGELQEVVCSFTDETRFIHYYPPQ